MDSSCLFYDLLAVFFFWKDFKYFPSISLLTFVLSLFLVHFNSFMYLLLYSLYCNFLSPSKSNYYLPPQQCNLPAGINCFYLIIFHLAFKIVLEMHLRFIASA